MSGLDKMKARIMEEAEQAAAEIIAEAQAEAKAEADAAEKAAEAQAEEILKRAEKARADQAMRAKSSLDMRRKQAYLAAKQEVIGRVLDEAYKAVTGLDTEPYFAMLERMLEKYVLPGEGEICFSEKDLKRMPKDFPEKIRRIAEAKGAKLTLSDVPREIDGGFLLVYGGVEENCTIRAVFGAEREKLSDQVNRFLFL